MKRRLQWAIIWASVLTATHVWLGLDLHNFFPQDGARWGLDGYLYPALTYHRSELAFVILLIGGLLSWQISAREACSLVGTLSTKAVVVACFVILLVLLALHFAPTRGSSGFGRF